MRAILAAADTAAVAAGEGIVLPAGEITVASNLTIASDVIFDAGAVIAPPAGVTVTFDGDVTAGARRQIINPDNGAAVLAAPWVSVHWWGALGDGATDDAPAIQAALDAAKAAGVVSGQEVRFLPLNYRIASGLTRHRNVTLRGSGRASSIISTSGAVAVNLLSVTAGDGEENGGVVGMEFRVRHADDVALNLVDATDGRYVNVAITNMGGGEKGTGVLLEPDDTGSSVYRNLFGHVRFTSLALGVCLGASGSNGANANRFENLTFQLCGQAVDVAANCYGNEFHKLSLERESGNNGTAIVDAGIDNHWQVSYAEFWDHVFDLSGATRPVVELYHVANVNAVFTGSAGTTDCATAICLIAGGLVCGDEAPVTGKSVTSFEQQFRQEAYFGSSGEQGLISWTSDGMIVRGRSGKKLYLGGGDVSQSYMDADGALFQHHAPITRLDAQSGSGNVAAPVEAITTGASDKTRTLPAHKVGQIFRLGKVDSGAGILFVDATSGMVAGESDFAIVFEGEWVTFISDGTDWHILGRHTLFEAGAVWERSTPAFATEYTPNQDERPCIIRATVNVTLTEEEHSLIELKVGGSGATVTVDECEFELDDTGLGSSSGELTVTLTGRVPIGDVYEIVATDVNGSPVQSIVRVREQVLP